MIDQLTEEIARGEGLGAAAAARRFPSARSGRPCHPATVTRRIHRGEKTADGRVVRLEAKRVGGQWVTSEGAIRRFIDAVQPPAADAPPPAAGGDRQAEVERELTDLGV